MKKLNNLIVVLCFGLALLPQAALSQDAGVVASKTVAVGPTNDAAAEEKARKFFTDLEVIDQNGKKLRFYSDVIKDRVVLISFIFTNCEFACPMQAQKLKQARAAMVPAITDDVWYVSLSVDPDRDTPEAMKKFAERQGVDESRWIFLTGDKQNLETIIRKLGQYTPDVEAHTTLMLAGNDRTRHWTRVMPMLTPPDIAQKMRELVEETPG
jgi:cytochrome oxidase Cu insertion factor (SCO1/SenC/PrrC family)